MKNKKQLVKRMLNVSFLLIIGVLLLTACNGAFSIQGSAQPNAEGGVDISGAAQPNSDAGIPVTSGAQPAAVQGIDQTTLILIIVGSVALILVLIMLASRRSSVDVIHHDKM